MPKDSKNSRICSKTKKQTPKSEEYYKYKKYIKSSKQWQEIKSIILDRDHHKCQFCNRTDEEETLTVHHKTYENLYNELEHLDDLITLYKICHYNLHRINANFNRFKKPK